MSLLGGGCHLVLEHLDGNRLLVFHEDSRFYEWIEH